NGGQLCFSEWMDAGHYRRELEPVYQAPEDARCVAELFHLSSKRSGELLVKAREAVLAHHRKNELFNAVLALAEDLNEALFLSAIAVRVIESLIELEAIEEAKKMKTAHVIKSFMV